MNEWTVSEGITMRLLQDGYPEGVEHMTIVMENRSGTMMSYGQGWTYEKYVNGEWVSLKNREDAAFTSEGYMLFDHSRATFAASTFALAEPLTAGLYRMTGSTVFMIETDPEAPDEERYVKMPAYELEFTVSAGAAPEPEETPAGSGANGLRNKEDWEWYTSGDCISLYESRGYTVWECMTGGDDSSLLAALYRENTPENEILAENATLMLDVFDRTTGETYTALGKPAVYCGTVAALPEGGFTFDTVNGKYSLTREGGEWTVAKETTSD